MVQISFRIDEQVKNEAERTLDEIGLSMSSALNIFLKKVARERRIPFALTADPFYSAENLSRLESSMREMESTGGTIHEVDYGD